ncbi:hypothetical protein [Streptomyces sp. NPDC057253]|uniref:hypothetical protein n=1 Tax=Streptomyces sp. NPDC057253 TaxID=3346069 RepID=UPI00362671E1
MGSLARALEAFLTQHGLALPTDQAQRLAAGRRRCRIDAIPLPLRTPVQAFAESMPRARECARKAGTLPRTDSTIETALAIVRDLARFLTGTRNKQDWALTDVHDVEAFRAAMTKARQRGLIVLRQYFRFARSHKIVLIDPTLGVKAKGPSGFSGTTVAVDQQRQLFRRWTTTDAHPHEALLGILVLLHAASSSEVRLLRLDDLDPTNGTIRLGKRPHPVPMRPVSWSTLQRWLAHRANWGTDNPYVIVTRITKTSQPPPGPLQHPTPNPAEHPTCRPGEHPRSHSARHGPRRRHDLPRRSRRRRSARAAQGERTGVRHCVTGTMSR